MTAAAEPLRAPFPYFGGKSRVAGLIWDRFGDVPNYIEPFFGSGAVLLQRPHPPRTETVNDLNAFLCNFWRAVRADPAAVADACDFPVNETELNSVHRWLVLKVTQDALRARLEADPDYFDPVVAGRWVWGACAWIGSGWCARARVRRAEDLDPEGGEGEGEPEGRIRRKLPHVGNAGRGVHRQLPHVGNAGRGVHRKLPHVGDAGRGINRQIPHVSTPGQGINRQLPHVGDAGRGVHRPPALGTDRGDAIGAYLAALAARLRGVRVCCGDWSRVLGPSVTTRHGATAVFLDPPYAAEATRAGGLYANDDLAVAHAVRAWALEHGDDPDLRICLAGYDGEHAMPESWECVAWKAAGGYGSQRRDGGNANPHRERLWFSPGCHRPRRLRSLFDLGTDASGVEQPSGPGAGPVGEARGQDDPK
jgi:hypothetical protein